VAAWELLWDAREAYARACEARKQGRADAPSETALKEARESLLAAEGSDWCWWFGPEHSTANDAEFDALYRKHLTAIYLMLGQLAPEELAKPIKRRPEHALCDRARRCVGKRHRARADCGSAGFEPGDLLRRSSRKG